jgi:hypothetical protein
VDPFKCLEKIKIKKEKKERGLLSTLLVVVVVEMHGGIAETMTLRTAISAYTNTTS